MDRAWSPGVGACQSPRGRRSTIATGQFPRARGHSRWKPGDEIPGGESGQAPYHNRPGRRPPCRRPWLQAAERVEGPRQFAVPPVRRRIDRGPGLVAGPCAASAERWGSIPPDRSSSAGPSGTRQAVRPPGAGGAGPSSRRRGKHTRTMEQRQPGNPVAVTDAVKHGWSAPVFGAGQRRKPALGGPRARGRPAIGQPGSRPARDDVLHGFSPGG